jgi:DNA-binding transcriptional ArsR family regulator
METTWEPAAYRELRDPREIKAFSDPLRLRIIRVLLDRQATNQQIADELGEPPAKVFHHVRFLVDAGVIRLVETRVSGRNVEKFYRAVARTFILRPDAALLPETRIAALDHALDRLRHGVLQSAATDEDDGPRVIRRVAHLDPERLAAFHEQLRNLVREYWGDAADHTNAASRAVLTVVTYREPSSDARETKEPGGG